MNEVRGANQAAAQSELSQPLAVVQLELTLERQLMIVIKLIRLHLQLTGSKYILGTLNPTC